MNCGTKVEPVAVIHVDDAEESSEQAEKVKPEEVMEEDAAAEFVEGSQVEELAAFVFKEPKKQGKLADVQAENEIVEEVDLPNEAQKPEQEETEQEDAAIPCVAPIEPVKAPLVEADKIPEEPIEAKEPEKAVEPVVQEAKPNKKGRKAIVAIAAVLAVVLLAVSGYTIWRASQDAASAPSKEADPSPEVSEGEPEKTPTLEHTDDAEPSEELTPEPSDELGPEPSPEQSEEPVVTVEPTPSIAAVPPVTTTPVPTPTPAPTPTPTPTPTPEPTPTPTPKAFPVGVETEIEFWENYTSYGDFYCEGIAVSKLTAIKNADGSLKFTVYFSTEQSFYGNAFDPPNGDILSQRISTITPGQTSVSFTIQLSKLSQIDALTIKFWNDNAGPGYKGYADGYGDSNRLIIGPTQSELAYMCS